METVINRGDRRSSEGRVDLGIVQWRYKAEDDKEEDDKADKDKEDKDKKNDNNKRWLKVSTCSIAAVFGSKETDYKTDYKTYLVSKFSHKISVGSGALVTFKGQLFSYLKCLD